MAYCRRGVSSDVYVYPTVDAIVCCCCPLGKTAEQILRETIQDWRTHHRREALAHLQQHRSSGHVVPQNVFDAISGEIAKVGVNCMKKRRMP
jgi:hypothetical protein